MLVKNLLARLLECNENSLIYNLTIAGIIRWQRGPTKYNQDDKQKVNALMTSKAPVGLIAVWKEADPLQKLMTVDSVEARLHARLYHGQMAGCPVVLAEVGMGKAQTAAVSQHLIDCYGVGLLVSCGSAGAIDSRLRVGDVVLADKVAPHDFGEFTDAAFNYLGIFDNVHPDGLHYHRYLAADSALLALARQAAAAISWPNPEGGLGSGAPAIEVGCIASGDQIIASELKKRWLRETLGAVAVEMECVGMAQTAFINGLPWLAVRAISDQADSGIDIDLSRLVTYSDEADTLAAKLWRKTSQAGQLVKDPRRLKAIMKIRQDIQRAASNAAMVTAAFISQYT